MVAAMTMETLVPIVLSAVAVILSVYVFIDSRQRDRRDIFIKMHELLISNDSQRGRYLLFEKVVDYEAIERLTDEEYRDINRALAMYNLLGVYLKNGYVNERDVIEVWGRTIYRAWMAAQPFLAYREQVQGYQPMPYFALLAEKVQEVLSREGTLPEYVIRRRSSNAD